MSIMPTSSNQTLTYLYPLKAVTAGLHSISRGKISLAFDRDQKFSGLDMVQTLLTAGWHDEARALLRQLTILAPQSIETWLQLFALDPSALTNHTLLEAFVQHHPQHPVAQALAQHLQQGRPGQDLPSTNSTSTSNQPMNVLRVGDYLVQAGWATHEQVQDALIEQQRLRVANTDRRLGTIMLMRNHVTPEQLAVALRPGLLANHGELGHVLVRSRILPPTQVAEALARQAMLLAADDRTYADELAAYHTNSIQGYIRRWQKPPTRQEAPKIGEVLVEMRLLTPDQITTILREQARLEAHK